MGYIVVSSIMTMVFAVLDMHEAKPGKKISSFLLDIMLDGKELINCSVTMER